MLPARPALPTQDVRGSRLQTLPQRPFAFFVHGPSPKLHRAFANERYANDDVESWRVTMPADSGARRSRRSVEAVAKSRSRSGILVSDFPVLHGGLEVHPVLMNPVTEPTGLEFAAKFSRCCAWVHFSSVKCTLMQERKRVGFGMGMHQDEKLLSSNFA